eukprot:765692-Hanusia_phi.AAC.3
MAASNRLTAAAQEAGGSTGKRGYFTRNGRGEEDRIRGEEEDEEEKEEEEMGRGARRRRRRVERRSRR